MDFHCAEKTSAQGTGASIAGSAPIYDIQVWLQCGFVASKPGPRWTTPWGKMREVLQTCHDFCVASAASAAYYSCQVNQLTGKARISDVIRSRFNAWKPDKSQAQSIPGKLEMLKKRQASK